MQWPSTFSSSAPPRRRSMLSTAQLDRLLHSSTTAAALHGSAAAAPLHSGRGASCRAVAQLSAARATSAPAVLGMAVACVAVLSRGTLSKGARRGAHPADGLLTALKLFKIFKEAKKRLLILERTAEAA